MTVWKVRNTNRKYPPVALSAFLAGWLLLCCLGPERVLGQTAVSRLGTVIPLPGHISEIVVDEARGQIYAANFSAGRVEVVSMTTRRRLGSILTSSSPSAITAMAMTHDSRFLVVASVPVSETSGSTVTVINLNDPGDRRFYTVVDRPLAMAFGANGEGLFVTAAGFQIFDPVTGTFTDVFSFGDGSSDDVDLPVPMPTFPREVVLASAAASRDGRLIYGVTDVFVYSFQVGLSRLTIRPIETIITPPVFPQASTAADGSYFMAGQLLFNKRLSVMADTLETGGAGMLIGGHVIDSEIDTVYAAFDVAVAGLPGQTPGAVLNVMDADNLFVRERFMLPEQVTGRLALASGGNEIYAVTESGLTHIPLGNLEGYPQLEVKAEDRNLLFQFDFCSQGTQTRVLRLESPDGSSASFRLSATDMDGLPAFGISFEPSQGQTPAEVQVTVAPSAVGNAQGTAEFLVGIETDAVNIPNTSRLFVNVRDLDQKGIFHEMHGRFVDIVADPVRSRFYVLDQKSFLVHMFDSDTFRLLGSFRTGNTPTWMTIGNLGKFLIIANSQAETLTFVDLDTLTKFGDVLLPWQVLKDGHFPMSVATDNSSVLILSKTPDEGEVSKLAVTFRGVRTPSTLGIFENSISPKTALVSLPDRSGIFFASSSGAVALWEALTPTTSKIILSRSDLSGLEGAIGAGSDFFVVGSHLLNSSLVPQFEFDDASAGMESSGFTLTRDGAAIRSLRPVSTVDSGSLRRFDPRDPRILDSPVRIVETPPAITSAFPFIRTLAALSNGKLASTGTAGIVELPVEFDKNLQSPRITAIVNSANFTTAAAVGGLISLFGENLAAQEVSAGTTPLPTTLGGTCVSMNGLSLPLLYVSPGQINAQASFSIAGDLATVVRNPGGLSNIFISTVSLSAPAVFSVEHPSEETLLKAVFRLKNNQLATLSNPFRHNEIGVIFATGLGSVTPIGIDGYPAASEPLSITTVDPVITVGGETAPILYSGLAPGFVGLYQINFIVPIGAPTGLQVPLVVTGSTSTDGFFIRIVEE